MCSRRAIVCCNFTLLLLPLSPSPLSLTRTSYLIAAEQPWHGGAAGQPHMLLQRRASRLPDRRSHAARPADGHPLWRLRHTQRLRFSYAWHAARPLHDQLCWRCTPRAGAALLCLLCVTWQTLAREEGDGWCMRAQSRRGRMFRCLNCTRL